jgi:hypothetical protein
MSRHARPHCPHQLDMHLVVMPLQITVTIRLHTGLEKKEGKKELLSVDAWLLHALRLFPIRHHAPDTYGSHVAYLMRTDWQVVNAWTATLRKIREKCYGFQGDETQNSSLWARQQENKAGPHIIWWTKMKEAVLVRSHRCATIYTWPMMVVFKEKKVYFLSSYIAKVWH